MFLGNIFLIVCLTTYFIQLSSAVDPVVQGKTKAEQFYKDDEDGKKVNIAICFSLCNSVHSSLLYLHWKTLVLLLREHITVVVFVLNL